MSFTEPLYTAPEMREAEATFSGPTLELMERAGSAVTETVSRRYAATPQGPSSGPMDRPSSISV